MSDITKEEKREILRIIKEGKQFSKFSLACAEAFTEYSNPKDSLNNYLAFTVKSYLDHNNMKDFVNGIRHWTKSKRIAIMP